MNDQSSVEKQIVICFRCASKQRFPITASKVKCSKCGAYLRYSEQIAPTTAEGKTGVTPRPLVEWAFPVMGAGLAGSASVLVVALLLRRTPSIAVIVMAAVIAFALGVGTRELAMWLGAARERRRTESVRLEQLRQLELIRQNELMEGQRRQDEAERRDADLRERRRSEERQRENARKQAEYEEREREEARRLEERKQRRRDEEEQKRRALEQLDGWKRLAPYDFEKEVARVLSACGARTTVTTQTADGGVDVEVTFEGYKYAVQCKRFLTSNVGGPDCQKLLGVVISENYAGGIIVTTSKLSRTARQFCTKNKSKIVALVGTDLLKLAGSPNADALRVVVRNCQK